MWCSRNKGCLCILIRRESRIRSIWGGCSSEMKVTLETNLCPHSSRAIFSSAFSWRRVQNTIFRANNSSLCHCCITSNRSRLFALKSFSSSSSLSHKYTVYTNQTKKRVVYIVLSLFSIFVCAYLHRITLMYSITKALHSNMNSVQSFQTGDIHSKRFESIYYSDKNKIKTLPFHDHNKSFVYLGDKVIESEPESFSKYFLSILRFFQFEHSNGSLCDNTKEIFEETFESNTLPKFSHSQSDGKEHIDKDLVADNSRELFSFAPFHKEQLPAPFEIDLIFTDVEEAFSTSLSVCFFYSFLFGLPLILYHLFCFFSPGLSQSQARKACFHIAVFMGVWYLLLWLIDVSLIPQLLKFLYSFQIKRYSLCLRAETKIHSYVSWCIWVYALSSALFVLSSVFVEYRARQISLAIRFPCSNTSENTTTKFFKLFQRCLLSPLSDLTSFWSDTKKQVTLWRYIMFSPFYVFSHLQKIFKENPLFFLKERQDDIKTKGKKHKFIEKYKQKEKSRLFLQEDRENKRFYQKQIGAFLKACIPNLIYLQQKVQNKEQVKIKQAVNIYKPPRAYIFCLCLLVAAFVSPPDPFTQFFCAFAMIVCHEFILVVSFVRASRLCVYK